MVISSWKRLFVACLIFILFNICCSVFDLIPPRINIIRPEDHSNVGWKSDIMGSVEERNLDRIEFFVNGDKVGEQRENEINYTITFPSEGAHYIRVKAYDKGGNWSELNLKVYAIFPGN